MPACSALLMGATNEVAETTVVAMPGEPAVTAALKEDSMVGTVCWVDLFPHLRTSMEFSLGRDTLPSQTRSLRGESRRLRCERDNAKELLPGCALWRIAQRDCCVAIMRPAFSAN